MNNHPLKPQPFRSLSSSVFRASTLAFSSLVDFTRRKERQPEGFSYGFIGTPIRVMSGFATALLLVFGMGATSASAQQTDTSLSALLQRGVVRVANTQTSPPWSYLGTDNQPTGYDVAVAHEIFKRLGVKKVVLVGDSFKNFIEGLKTDKYDVVVNSMAHTPERDKVVSFTVPYAVQDFRIWVNNRTNDIASIAALKGQVIGVTAGTSNELWARNHLSESNIKTYNNSGLLYNDLAAGRVTAVIDSYANGIHTQTVNHLPVKAVGPVLLYSLGSAVVPKNANALRLAMDKAIAEMIADGTLQRLAHRFFGADYDMVGDIKKGQAIN